MDESPRAIVDKVNYWRNSAEMENSALERRVQAVREFSRFYTQQLGVLNEKLLGSKYSLAEVRVLLNWRTEKKAQPGRSPRISDSMPAI